MANVNLIDSDTIEIEQTNNNIQMNIADGVIPTIPEIKDTYSTSQNNSYSCNYVNNSILSNYSTSERKTNRVWIDGKPVYEKIIKVNNFAVSNGAWTYHNITNLGDYYCLYRVVLMDGQNNMSACGTGTSKNGSSEHTGFRMTSDKITCIGNNSWSAVANRYWIFFIEYTKSTD